MTATPAPTLDWDALEDELVRLLSDYLRIDTSNPPGNEALAARWFGDLLRNEGIESEYYESAPGRESLIARLPGSEGSGQEGALILLNHTDVVPVQAEYWSQPPFGGVLHDGRLWGRGALDMKSLGMLEYVVFVLFKRMNLPHRRDLIFFAIADEEAGGEFGVEWFARHHPELMRCWAVINEGGGATSSFMGVERPIFSFSAAEKTPLWLRLRTEGPPGHGSVPHANNALVRLVKALGKINDWKRERTIVPEVEPYFAGLAAAGLLEPIADVATAERIAEKSPVINALTEDTISITGCTAGIKVNVIPAVCEATLDCRLLPGRKAEEFVEDLRRQIDDPKVEIQRIFSAEGPSSSLNHELYALARSVVLEHVEDALVLPSVSTGFTDSRTFREMGIPAYGFSPTLASEEERRTVHGHDERVQVESLRLGLQILFEVVRRALQ